MTLAAEPRTALASLLRESSFFGLLADDALEDLALFDLGRG